MIIFSLLLITFLFPWVNSKLHSPKNDPLDSKLSHNVNSVHLPLPNINPKTTIDSLTHNLDHSLTTKHIIHEFQTHMTPISSISLSTNPSSEVLSSSNPFSSNPTSEILPLDVEEITSGYGILSLYAQNDCTNLLLVYGIQLGTCVTLGSNSTYFTCDSSTELGERRLFQHYYAGPDCLATPTITYTSDISESCQESYQFTCSKDKNYIKKLPSGFMLKQSDESNCDEVASFAFIKTGTCIDSGDSSLKIGCDSSSLTVKVYEGSTCADANFQGSVGTSFPTGCQATNSDDDFYGGDDFYGSNFYNLQPKYTQYQCVDGNDDNQACFSLSELVTTPSGDVPISEMKVGDQILTVSDERIYHYADIVFIPHSADNTNLATFHEIVTNSGRHLKVTEDHLVEATANCNDGISKLQYAKDIEIGSCVQTIFGYEAVVSNVRVMERGVFTVVTSESSGKIVVNGFIASSFGNNHYLVNTYYHLYRWIYTLSTVISTYYGNNWLLSSRHLVAMTATLGNMLVTMKNMML